MALRAPAEPPRPIAPTIPIKQRPRRFAQPFRPGGLFQLAIAQTISASGALTQLAGTTTLPVAKRDREIADGLATRWLRTERFDGSSYRILTIRDRRYGAIEIGRNVNDVMRSLSVLRRRFILLVLAAAIAAATIGYAAAMVLGRPILRLARAVARAGTTNVLDVLPDDQRGDEIGVLARSFRRTFEALGRSQAQQRQLIQDASHELRTPLTSLRTNIDLLQRYDSLKEPDRIHILADLQTEARELTDLLDELVVLAIEGQTDEVDSSFDLRVVSQDLVARFKARTSQTFDISIATEAAMLVAPRRSVERAINNLLDNAVKFAPSDSIIHIAVAGNSFEVTNEAEVIADSELEHLFERFYRTASARSFRGSGLGLAIVQDTVTAIGGVTYAYNSPTAFGNSITIGFRVPTTNL
jgi:two-component system sensor histidine kinase MprB